MNVYVVTREPGSEIVGIYSALVKAQAAVRDLFQPDEPEIRFCVVGYELDVEVDE